MAAEEKLGEIYVAIKAKMDQFDADIKNLKQRVVREKTEIERNATFKTRFDNSIAQLDIKKLQDLRKRLQQEFDKKIKMNVDSASLERTREKMDSVNKALRGINDEASKSPSLFKQFGIAATAAFSAAKLIQFGFEAVKLAGKVEGIKVAFDRLNQPTLLDELRRATRNTVADWELMQTAMRASNFKIPLDQLATLLEFAQKRATQTGEAVDYLVNSIVDGIGRKSSLVLDNLGISATELQDEIRKVGDFGQAAANIVERELGKMGDVAETTADRMAQLNAQIENQKAALGKDLLPYWNSTLRVLGWATNGLVLFTRALANFVTFGQSEVKKTLQDLNEEHQKYARLLMLTYKLTDKNSSAIMLTYKQQTDTVGQVIEKIGELQKEQLGLVYGSDEYLKNLEKIKKLEQSIGIDKSPKQNVEVSFSIPSGYTAEQVAEFEKLKFAAAGYVDFRIAQINLAYDQELARAKGNKDAIAKAEENKKLAIARLEQEITQIRTDAAETTVKEINKINEQLEAELLKQLDDESDAITDSYKKREDALAQYFNSTKIKTEEYYNFKKRKIQEEYLEFLDVTGNIVLAERMKNEKLMELNEEYREYQFEQWRALNQETERITESIAGAFTSGLFDQLKIKADQTNNALIRGFHNMANAFISEVERMIAKWLLLMTLRSIFAAVSGGASEAVQAIPAIPGAHYGGDFVGTSKGVKKLSKGGSFTVPQGFPNDSYPLLVESGERVSATPASRVGNQDRLLAEINNSIRAMNLNLVRKDLSVNIENRSPDVEVIVKRLKKVENQLSIAGMNFNER